MANFKDVVIPVGERKCVTEVVSYESTATDWICVLTPGNPGVITYYETFLKDIYDGFKGRMKVIGVGHAGHCRETIADGSLYNLEDQIIHKISFLETLHKENPKTNIILTGHSVGSYINIQVKARRPDLPIRHFVQLFPTICELRVAPSVHVLTYSVSSWLVSRFVSVLPLSVKRFITSLMSSSKTEAEQAIPYSHSGFLHNVLHMVATELDTIKGLSNQTENVVKSTSDITTWLFTETDQYVPPNLYSHLESVFPNCLLEKTPTSLDVIHAFVLKDSKTVARIVLCRLRENEHLKHFIDDIADIHQLEDPTTEPVFTLD